MSIAIKEMNRVELVNLDRLAHILKGLSIAELETLERGEGIQIEKSIM